MLSLVLSGRPGASAVVIRGLLLALAAPAPAAAQSAQKAAPTLDAVVVTASGFEQAVADAPASITIITKEELEGKAYRDVTDALQGIPGVSIEGGASGKLESTSVNIRGLGENYVLFLIDGRPLGASSEAYYNGFGGGAQTAWMPPLSSIERIEVIRGPMSSLYGSSALGGVINLITKKVPDKWTGSVTLNATLQAHSNAGNATQGTYYLSGPIVEDALALTLYGVKYRRNEDKYIGGYARKDSYDNTAKLSWKLNPAHSLELEGGQARTDNRRSERSGSPSDMRNTRKHFVLSHEWNWGNGNRSNSYIMRERVDIENGTNESGYRSTLFNTRTVLPFDAHMLTLGAEFKKEQTDHDGSRFPGSKTLNLKRWQAALFAEDEYNVTDDWAVTVGLRADDNEKYGKHFTPRLYSVYHLTDALALKGGVGGGYRTPTLKQADDNIVELAARGRAWDMGNDNLKPEKSTNYELGFTWADEHGVSGSLMAYQTRFKDKIETQTICSSPAGAPACYYNGEVRQEIRQYVNVNSATLRGVEAALRVPVARATLDVNYTYSDSEITSGTSKGRALNNLPRHMFNIAADSPVTEKLALWGKVRFKSKTLEGGSDQIPSYTLVDVGARYAFHKNLSGFFGIYNLFDKEVSSQDYGKTLDGRRFYVGLTAGF
ncbi:TonB-dependent receptor domain-containing protein [Bordetella trematum]|uniref:TonB-dependent receptor domain-containing protein n=1 Tax=Bordetella trematum TaxID=123899 RepID=UPI000B10B198|nr:TonB-dependent receptor [Bordetella trematum]